MKFGLWCLLVGSLFTAKGAVSNGSFEEPAISIPYQVFSAGESIGGWVVESGTIEIVGPYWQAAAGRQSVDLSGIWDLVGTIYQDIPTIPGQEYTVRFAFAGNPEDGATKQMKVFWNASEIADLTVDTAGRSLADMGWSYYTYKVTATSTSSRLAFQSLTLNFLGPVIDDVSVTPVASAALLANGSFETPVIGPRYQAFLAGENIGGWIVESGSVEIVGPYWQSAEGNQGLDLSGIFEMAGTIYQDINTVPGQTYKIRFAFAGNPEDQAIKEAKVFWNETELAKLTVDTAGRSLADMGWTYYTYAVTATGATSRLKFQSLTLNFLGPAIDDVSVTRIVPSTLSADLVVRIRVTGIPGDRYRIEYSSRASEPEWHEFATVTLPESGEITVFDEEGIRGRQRTYRAINLTTEQ
jgi:choice-of-anchor C domain-containing protein